MENSPLRSFYDTAKATEDTVFALSPVPLGIVKAGVQNVAVPLAVTATASHTPLVGPVVGTAMKYGAEAFANGTHHLALEAMNNLGQSVVEGLPSGMGLQSSFNFVSSRMADVTLAGQDLITPAIGAVGTAVMLGRTATNAAVLTFNNVKDMSVNQILDKGRQDIQRTQQFLSTAAVFVRVQGRKVEGLVNLGLAKFTPYNPTVNMEDSTQTQVAQGQSTQASPDQGVKIPVSESTDNKDFEPITGTEKAQGQAVEPITPNPSSEQAEDYVLNTIVDALNKARVDTERLSITLNGETIFKMDGATLDTDRTGISEEHQKIIQQALEDPAAFGGNLKITVGGKVYLNIEQGRLMNNTLNLAKPSTKIEMSTADQAQTPQNVSEGLWGKYGAGQPNTIIGLSNAAKQAAKAGVDRSGVTQMLKNSPFYQEQAKDNQKQADILVQNTARNAVFQANKQERQPEVQQQQEQVVAPAL